MAEAQCIFCRIVAGELPATVLYSDDRVVAFRDIDPKAPTHVLVIPRKHIPAVNALAPEDLEVAGALLLVAKEVARQERIDGSGYRLVINNGGDAGQAVDHLHLHVLGGRRMTWPPG